MGCDCDRYMEVWNLVFSQFNNDGEGHYTELKQKNIDTGMGLERLAVVCQDVDSLFDVDTVMNITHRVSEITGAHYGESKARDVSLRVITDHIRSATFMICDGVLPSNEGRGYVLRRLLRRAARHGKLLGVNEPFLYEVCDTVIHENEGHYPELRERQDYITKVIRVEEENFARTIDGGLKIFMDMLDGRQGQGRERLFRRGRLQALRHLRLPHRPDHRDGGGAGDARGSGRLPQADAGAEGAGPPRPEALGDLGWARHRVRRGYARDQVRAATTPPTWKTARPRSWPSWPRRNCRDEVRGGTEAILVLDQTPFYAEMGGQVADHGVICCGGRPL